MQNEPKDIMSNPQRTPEDLFNSLYPLLRETPVAISMSEIAEVWGCTTGVAQRRMYRVLRAGLIKATPCKVQNENKRWYKGWYFGG